MMNTGSSQKHQTQWIDAYNKSGVAHKNKYPSDRVVGWVMRNQRRGQKCLDIGCGWGNNLRFLLDEGFDAYGIDYAAPAIAEIRHDFEGRVTCQSIYSTSFADGEFHFVIDRCAIQHNSNIDLPVIFEEVHRILKTEGGIYSELRKSGDDGLDFAGQL